MGGRVTKTVKVRVFLIMHSRSESTDSRGLSFTNSLSPYIGKLLHTNHVDQNIPATRYVFTRTLNLIFYENSLIKSKSTFG